jgi:hypothetical protein
MTDHERRCRGCNALYRRCANCDAQYCPTTYPRCPRESWHPDHATTDLERGRRYAELRAAGAVLPPRPIAKES